MIISTHESRDTNRDDPRKCKNVELNSNGPIDKIQEIFVLFSVLLPIIHYPLILNHQLPLVNSVQ